MAVWDLEQFLDVGLDTLEVSLKLVRAVRDLRDANACVLEVQEALASPLQHGLR